MGNLRIGTSGWNYPTGRGTWNGVFYPPPAAAAEGVRRARLLRRALRHGRGELDVLRPAARGGHARGPSGRRRTSNSRSSCIRSSRTRDVRRARCVARCRRRRGPRRGAARRARAAERRRSRRVPARHRPARLERASWARCSRSFRRASRTAPAQRDYLAHAAARASRTIPSPWNCAIGAGATPSARRSTC